MTQLLLILILLLAFGAVFMVARMFFAGAAREQAVEALGGQAKAEVSRSLLLKLSRPFITRMVPLTRGISAPHWRLKRQRDILAGGLTGEITVDELWAYKFFLALVALALLFMFNHDASWWAWPFAAFLGFYFPDRWVRDRVNLRQRQIVRALPSVADMLALSVEAGLDFMGAIGKVVAKSRPSPLIEELSLMLGEIRLGASRAEGLRNLAYRCNVTSLSAFVAVLIQADKLGVSIGQVLRAQSDKLRTDRFQQAERLGAQATQKILLPLILCIMPAVFVVIIGPLVLKYVLGF
ncbi:MAG: type II secretion system F family protein [Desulfarculus sp.]|nr:type II secretion system F family protein [Desulfarculus sp.]